MTEARQLSPLSTLGVAAAVLLTVAVVFWPTFASMVEVWGQSDTFSYGYLVLPMAFWSLWQTARRLGPADWQPSWLGGMAMVPAAGAWFVGEAVGVQALAQYGMVGMFIAGCWTILGNAIAYRLRFGLGFALFAVPVGEFMIPWLMDVTADFTVAAVHMTGIPVYRTERFFTLPSGNFEVVEACSGIRFLIVTLVLATWYAQQTFTRLWHKIAFVAMAGVVMNVANGIRAFIIVLMVHYSEGRLAVGYDHIVYGWVVFILGLIVIVQLGKLFRGASPTPGPLGGSLRLSRTSGVAAAVVGVGLVIGGVRFADASIDRNAGSATLAELRAPVPASGWTGPAATAIEYAPAYSGATQALAVRYQYAQGAVEVHKFKYNASQEIVRFDNQLYDARDWRLIEAGTARVTLATGQTVSLIRRVIERDGQRLQVLSWFDIGGRVTASPIRAKWYRALRSVLGGEGSDVMFAVVAPTREGADNEPPLAFVEAHFDALRHCARSQSESAQCSGRDATHARR